MQTVITFRSIRKKYPREWVLVEHERLGKNLEVKKGRLIAHSPNREIIYKALGRSFGKNVSVEYTGPVDKDLTVMFILVS